MRSRFPFLLAILFAGFLLCLPSVLHGDLIILVDGFVLEGETKRDSELEVDPITKEPFVVPKGFFYVDDGPRRVYFAQSLVRVTRDKEPDPGDTIKHGRNPSILNPRKMPPIHAILDTTAWDQKWERRMDFLSEGRRLSVGQHISQVTPYWIRVDGTTRYLWACAYLTKEFSLEKMHRILAAHKAFKEPDNLSDEDKAQRRLRYAQFFAQAGWYGEAERELYRMIRQLPEFKEQAEHNLGVIQRIRAREGFEAIKRAYNAGQYKKVKHWLKIFPKKLASDQLVANLEEFEVTFDRDSKRLDETKQRLRDLAMQVQNSSSKHKTLFFDAGAFIYRQVTLSTHDRLEAFLGQARQAERQAKKGKTPTLDPENLLSLAVSGWLLGSASATAKTEQAVRLWKGREVIHDYLKGDTAGARERVLTAYNSEAGEPLPLDIFTKLITTLEPPSAESDLSPEPREIRTRGAGRAPTYIVDLPSEYSHSQSYPVILLLHNAGQKPLDLIRKWSEAAENHGYILCAPYWEQGLGGSYNYSEAEHSKVTQSLVDLTRRFNVDSDRVFLFGLGQGGDMAFDLGMAKPHLFAGVIPMGGTPNYFGARYWRNAQYLPFLVINGDRSGDCQKNTRILFDQWIMRNFPMIWVNYKGRGIEWFGGELDNMFDWMRIKTRKFPLFNLGASGTAGLGTEFESMRSTDTRFYWLESDGIHRRCLNNSASWNNRITPASIRGKIDPVKNVINVNGRGVSKLTIWLGRNSRGESMIDFEKPVTVHLGFRVVRANHRVKPELSVLLEDLYQRGDRRHFFLGKIDIP